MARRATNPIGTGIAIACQILAVGLFTLAMGLGAGRLGRWIGFDGLELAGFAIGLVVGLVYLVRSLR